MKMLLVLAPALLFFSCAHVNVDHLKSASAKAPECQLETYNKLSDVKKPYEIVCALASATGTTLFADKSLQHAIDIARPEACACGGDAMVISNSATEGMTLMSYGKSTANISVLKYTEKKSK